MRRRTWGFRSTAALVLLAAVLLGAVGTGAPARRAASADEQSKTAAASVDDSELNWGDSTTLHGSGWAPGKTIKVILYAGGTTLASPVAAADGTITATITAPRDIASSNQYALAVQGDGGDGLYGYVSVPLTIVGPTPTVSIADDELHWNETTTVSGDRWQTGASLTISLAPENRTLTTVVVGAGNHFDASVQMPSGIRSSKDYYVSVAGEGSDRLFHIEVVTVTVEGDRPTVHLSSSKVARGGSLTVTGRLFLKDTSVTITLLPGYEELATVDVADDATFSSEVTIPDDAGGKDPHAVLVTGQGQDGLFAYVATQIDLGGKAPAGKGANQTAADVLNGATPPSGGALAVAATLPPTKHLADAGDSNYLLVILLILLLAAATVALLVVTARRDVRRKLRLQGDLVLRRLHLRRAP